MTYASVAGHREMVFDVRRNAAYLAALKTLVGPETVVLDLGAGLGVLGLHAAACGAARVYMVEPAPVAKLARDIAAANGFAERVVVLPGRIEDVTLPEPVDIIVSVFTGNLLFSEDLLPSLFLARDRYLKPGGRLLPDLAQLCVAPIMHPELHARHIAGWSAPQLALDFSAARPFARHEIIWPERGSNHGLRLTEDVVLVTVDLAGATHADCDASASVEVQEAGECHGLLVWIRMQLGDTWLSTDPDLPPLHWQNAVLPLDPPLLLQRGETLHLRVQRPLGGDWTWSVQGSGGRRQHSTFLARLDNRERLERQAARAGASSSGTGSPESA